MRHSNSTILFTLLPLLPGSYYAPLGLLFDLDLDPSETYGYTRENPQVAARLRGHLERGQTALNTTVLQQMWNR